MAYDNINYTPTKVPLGEEPKTGWARPNKDWEFIRNWYKNFPDWQSSLPKTDCTNSKHSVWYYHEFVPGVLVLPNLSRRPLRTRYNISSSIKSSRFLCNDSDLSFSSLNGSIEQNQKVWYQKLITTIRTILITTTTTLFLNNNSSVRNENGIGGNDFSDEDVTDHQTFLIKKESWFKVMITKILNASLETTKIFYAINRVMSVIGVFLLLHSRKIIGVRTTRRKNLALFLLLLLILGWLYAYGRKRSTSGISFDSKFVSFTYVWNSLLPSTLTATLLGIKSLFNKPFISKQEEDIFVTTLNVIPSHEQKNKEINSNINDVLLKADFNVQALEKKYEDLSAIFKHLAQLDHKISESQKEWELSTVNKLTKLQEDWSINAEQKLLQDQQHWKMDIESKLSKEQKNWEADAKASLIRMQKEWDLIAKETLSQQKSNWEESTKTNLLQIQNDLESSANLKLSQQQEDLEKLTGKKLLQLQKELKLNIEEKILQDQNDWKVNLETKLLQLQKDWELNVEASLQQQKLSDVNLKTKLVQQEGEERFISLQTEVDGILTELNSISNKIMELQTQINEKNVITHVSGTDVCVDEIALPDYALFSSGGFVCSTRCTESASINLAYSWYGFDFNWFSSKSDPLNVLKPSIQPGECWCFVGSEGHLVINLSATIIITSVTLEHAHKELLAPKAFASAPQRFSVYGLKKENDENPALLGTFTYEDNGLSLQHFKTLPITEPYKLVELFIQSNHGGEHTCIYRFRVHGMWVKTNE